MVSFFYSARLEMGPEGPCERNKLELVICTSVEAKKSVRI